jgi:uncharacterized membrane protein YeaQ/YmgE (transglycosylase-associated protein family)
MRNLLLMLGLPDFPMESLILFLAVVALAALALGWISDLILGDGGYGVTLNTGLILTGAVIGAWLWHRFGVPTRFHQDVTRTGVAMGSGLLMLLFCGVMRRWV